MPLTPIPVTEEQAKAVQKLADLGTTIVEEGGQLARYIGRVLGTAPEDAVGLRHRRSSPCHSDSGRTEIRRMDIRNAFAHSLGVTDFETPRIKALT
jgi:hypothetical protein